MNKRRRAPSGTNHKKQKKTKNESCPSCNQLISSATSHSRPPSSSSELIALTAEKLSIFTGNEAKIDESDELPTHKITDYTVYGRCGHLCAFDAGLIEKNGKLYISGCIKPIYDEDPSRKNGISVCDAGPVTEWYIAGFDGGENALIGLVTNFAQYILMAPSKKYAPFVTDSQSKTRLVKVVIEFLLDNCDRAPSLDELLAQVENVEFLLENAQFLCEQVQKFDELRDDDEHSLLDLDCVKDLLNLVGIHSLNASSKQFGLNSADFKPKSRMVEATGTDLVKTIFRDQFSVGKQSKSAFLTIKTSTHELKLANLLKSTKDGLFYGRAARNGVEVKFGDFFQLKSGVLGQVSYIYCEKNLKNGVKIHLKLLTAGCDTIMGEVAPKDEVYMSDKCENYLFDDFSQKTIVKFNKTSETGVFYCTKEYEDETGTFSTYYFNTNNGFECDSCLKRQKRASPRINERGDVEYKGEVYCPNDFIFLNSVISPFKDYSELKTTETPLIKYNKKLYPEKWRKTETKTELDTIQPFLIGQIEKIDCLNLKVRLLCRPENVKNNSNYYNSDINLLYVTNTILSINCQQLEGKCFVRFFTDEDEARKWSDLGPFRFYCMEKYCLTNERFEKVEKFVESGNEGGWGPSGVVLNCLDVFAGCGGLSLGLHQSGVAITKWAIEKDAKAAEAYKLNNPNCKVFTDDCNNLLKAIITEKSTNLPKKGEVDLLVGGPPCQGFSTMNQFQTRTDSIFKNSLIVTYLSFCDYLRPKYFILENVRSFATYQKSLILKLTIKSLLEMSYQVRWGVLQAGHFGMPQSRRRFILIAALPHLPLPHLPPPLCTFTKKACHLSLTIDNRRYSPKISFSSAPYRATTIRDALSDLPPVEGGAAYLSPPKTTFQRRLRANSDHLTDHVCKKMAPIVVARIERIPAGGDWRHLPNARIRLVDGATTKLLKYDANGGVCACLTNGKKCDGAGRQTGTLIPWCLPHTADRHNNWAGLYGRLDWAGCFSTTVTNPEPMGKQGRVLHPVEDRVVSVRECARSQGFPDGFRFVGNVMDRYRQIGNAVPPPLGRAIGLEIRKSLK